LRTTTIDWKLKRMGIQWIKKEKRKGAEARGQSQQREKGEQGLTGRLRVAWAGEGTNLPSHMAEGRSKVNVSV